MDSNPAMIDVKKSGDTERAETAKLALLVDQCNQLEARMHFFQDNFRGHWLFWYTDMSTATEMYPQFAELQGQDISTVSTTLLQQLEYLLERDKLSSNLFSTLHKRYRDLERDISSVLSNIGDFERAAHHHHVDSESSQINRSQLSRFRLMSDSFDSRVRYGLEFMASAGVLLDS